MAASVPVPQCRNGFIASRKRGPNMGHSWTDSSRGCVKDPLADAVIADFGHDLSRYWIVEGALNAGLHRAGRGLPPPFMSCWPLQKSPCSRLTTTGWTEQVASCSNWTRGWHRVGCTLVGLWVRPAGNKPLILSTAHPAGTEAIVGDQPVCL